MSQLHTFYSKISKKRRDETEIYPHNNNNNKGEEASPSNIYKKKNTETIKHQPLPKLIKYVNAKQYFKVLNQFESEGEDGDIGLGDDSRPDPRHSKLWPLYDDEVQDGKITDLLWSWIEKPFLSLVLPKKNVWWAMSENNEYFPSVTQSPHGNQNIIQAYIIHLIIWVPIFYMYYNNPICDNATQKPIVIGFVFGIFCFILIDILNSNNTDLLVDKEQMRWNITTSEKQVDDMTVIKKGNDANNIFGNMDKTHGLIFKPEKFSSFAVKKNLHLLPLKDWYTNYWRKHVKITSETDEIRQSNAAKAQKSIGSSAYYLISNIVTLGIVTARANLKYFRFITPLILLISIITICGMYNWVWSYHDSQEYNDLNFKRKILIESISLSITCCLLAINCKFFRHHNYSYDKIFI
jgi:hypothetical protein